MTWPSVLLQWSFDPSVVVGIVLAAVLYWRGRTPVAIARERRNALTYRWQAVSFYTGLVVVFVALESPIDTLSASLFTFHMLQHLLLIMVAAPLLLLGDPAITLLRGVSLTGRRAVLGYAARQTWVHRVGRVASWFMRPAPAFFIFTFDLYLWHWNKLFNLTLQNDAVHLLEHSCFLITALLFWSQVVDQRALHARLSYVQRAIFTLLASAASNVLALYFVFTPRVLYSAYADQTHRSFGMTGLGDQQLAGALMWIPVLFIFGGAFAVCLYKALSEDEHERADAVPAGTTPYSMVFAGDGAIANGSRWP